MVGRNLQENLQELKKFAEFCIRARQDDASHSYQDQSPDELANDQDFIKARRKIRRTFNKLLSKITFSAENTSALGLELQAHAQFAMSQILGKVEQLNLTPAQQEAVQQLSRLLEIIIKDRIEKKLFVKSWEEYFLRVIKLQKFMLMVMEEAERALLEQLKIAAEMEKLRASIQSLRKVQQLYIRIISTISEVVKDIEKTFVAPLKGMIQNNQNIIDDKKIYMPPKVKDAFINYTKEVDAMLKFVDGYKDDLLSAGRQYEDRKKAVDTAITKQEDQIGALQGIKDDIENVSDIEEFLQNIQQYQRGEANATDVVVKEQYQITEEIQGKIDDCDELGDPETEDKLRKFDKDISNSKEELAKLHGAFKQIVAANTQICQAIKEHKFNSPAEEAALLQLIKDNGNMVKQLNQQIVSERLNFKTLCADAKIIIAAVPQVTAEPSVVIPDPAVKASSVLDEMSKEAMSQKNSGVGENMSPTIIFGKGNQPGGAPLSVLASRGKADHGVSTPAVGHPVTAGENHYNSTTP